MESTLEGTKNPKRRRRAGLACASCNKLKTKCDVFDKASGESCSRCIKADRACVPLQSSKRGKYDRSAMNGGTSTLASTSNLSPPPLPILPTSNLSPPLSSSTCFEERVVSPSISSSLYEEAEPQQDSAWVNLFSSTLKDRAVPNGGVMYVSELFTLAHLLRQNWTGSEKENGERVHFPKSGSAGANGLNVDQLRYLTETGCFTLPPKDVLDCIVDSYFASTHPIYPVINRSEFMRQYAQVFEGGVPLLLLWAVLYVGSTHCDLEALTRAGFPSRFLALQSFYTRGHALYSLGFEPDNVCVVQFQFLISQIWSGVEDSHFWAGKASSLAQSLGFHRSTVDSKFLSTETRSLWKRIWFCVYIRDRHSAAATGRPYHILDVFSDVELPTPDDFKDGEDCELFLRSISLAKIVGNVVLVRLSLGITDLKRIELQTACYAELTAWHASLPRSLTYDGSLKDIFVTFLHLSYHCWVIHLYRSKAGTKTSSPIASESAATAIRLFEDLIQHGEILRTPQFGNTALFAAVGVVLLDRQLGRGDTNRRLSSHRLTVAMLAAKELASARPVANWFGSLFASLDSRTQANSIARTPDISANNTDQHKSILEYDSAAFLDLFKGMEGQSYFDDSGLFNFDSLTDESSLW